MKKLAGLLASVGIYNLSVIRLNSILFYANLIVGVLFLLAAAIVLICELTDDREEA